MGKGKVKGKHRLDKYYHLAKDHGYRSRASWKLLQLDSKFSFLPSAHSVLDLCAAPGGWMQVAVERVPVGSLVVGVDLVAIRPVRGAIAIEQDITKPECKARIKRIMCEKGCAAFDLVLHDGSPNVGGAWAQEAMSQNALVIDSIKLATNLLAPKGTFVTKLFEKVEVDKPAASRSTSAEIYLLGRKYYKALAKIDPRLLDFKHLFQGNVEPQKKVVDVLRGTTQKRHREGYEDGKILSRKVASAADFIWSDSSPIDILGSVTSLSFDDPTCLSIKDHALTTEVVKSLCDDLRVLGKSDFRHLLTWRTQLRKALSPDKKDKSTPTKDVADENKNEDDRILNEMEELTNAIDQKKKRTKKLLAKRRAKEKARKATGMQVDVMEDGYIDDELFSLSAIKGKKGLVAVDSSEHDYENGDLANDGIDETHEETQEQLSSDVDSNEERRRYDDQMEDLLDQAYERYMDKKGGSAKQRKRAKQSYSQEAELLEYDANGDISQPDYDSDKDEADEEKNPLMVLLDDMDGVTQEDIVKKWFSQDIFTETAVDREVAMSESEDDMRIDKAEKKSKTPIQKGQGKGDCERRYGI